MEPQAFVDGELRPHPLGDDRPYVVTFDPDVDFAGEYDLANRFTRRFEVTVNDARTATRRLDVSQFGSLYERIVERLLKPDAERQGVELAHHPWYPVLLIGAHKAELYTRALIGDIVHKRHDLADPGWLVRVGLYLELLTCLGVFAAVGRRRRSADARGAGGRRDGWDDLELNVEGWRGSGRCASVAAAAAAGAARTCSTSAGRRSSSCTSTTRTSSTRSSSPGRTTPTRRRPGTGCSATPSAPCCARRRTPSPSCSDCRRRCGGSCSGTAAGHVGLKRALRVPGPLPRLLGDQDGLFASACNQYRASMNHVADWAQARGLMDHTGEEAVPRQVSLLEAHMNQPTRVALLQAPRRL